MSVRMLAIAAIMALALIFSPLSTPPSNASAMPGGLEKNVPNVSIIEHAYSTKLSFLQDQRMLTCSIINIIG
jgi:hypothetical protein